MDGWEVLESVEFVIPSLPPSVNTIYQINFRQREVFMHPDVRRWKTESKLFIPKMKPLPDSHLFRVDCVFFYDFFYKNGKVRKFDTPNLLKVLIDAVAEKNEIDDKLVKFGGWESYHGTSDKVNVKVSQVAQKTLFPLEATRSGSDEYEDTSGASAE